MDWYYFIAVALIVSQVGLIALAVRNYRYAIKKYQKSRIAYRPNTAIIIPCKGVDLDFQKNITSFFNQDYENFRLWFVVEDESDPAYEQLRQLKQTLANTSKAKDIQILVSGYSDACSQKIHNLLYCYKRISPDIEVLAFADSDTCVRSDWLSHLVHPLRKDKNGAASGYRWFVPKTNNPATLALSAINAKIVQLLGNTPFNQAWGGSMAIRVETFRQAGLEEIWPKSLSDDLSLSYAVRKIGKKVLFVPACLVASYESTTWKKLFEFGRRQFLITRIYSPRTWRIGLYSAVYSVIGLWASAGLAVYAAGIRDANATVYAVVPVLFFAGQLTRVILRQRMISKLLKQDWPKMKAACLADVFFFWAWSFFMLFFIISSMFGRTICWRDIRYKMLGPTQTVIIDS